jgi:hypothetical protein
MESVGLGLFVEFDIIAPIPALNCEKIYGSDYR